MRIFLLWDKGETAAPSLVRQVAKKWRKLNPEHEIVFLDAADLATTLSDENLPLDGVDIQAMADILRVKLVLEQGGVWVDATLLPVAPLRCWLPPLLAPAGAFLFRNCGYDRLIGNWFIAGEAGNPLIAAWFAAIRRYMATPRRRANERNPIWRAFRRGDYIRSVMSNRFPFATRRPYFYPHYLFENLVRTDDSLRDHFSRMPLWPVHPTHALQHARFIHRPSDEDFRRAIPILLRMAPVQKLDWRHEWPEEVFQDIDPETVVLGPASAHTQSEAD